MADGRAATLTGCLPGHGAPSSVSLPPLHHLKSSLHPAGILPDHPLHWSCRRLPESAGATNARAVWSFPARGSGLPAHEPAGWDLGLANVAHNAQ
jgi:hypothetical protein